MPGYLLIDIKKCQGCLTCMLACSLAHHGTADLAGSQIRISQNSFGRYPDDITSEPVQTCSLCVGAEHWSESETLTCVALCPVGAIRFSETLPEKDEDGAYRINFREKGWKKIGYETD